MEMLSKEWFVSQKRSEVVAGCKDITKREVWLGLPKVTGTTKQVIWARKLRYDMLSGLLDLSDNIETNFTPEVLRARYLYTPVSIPQELRDYVQCLRPTLSSYSMGIFYSLLKVLTEIKNADWFIINRDRLIDLCIELHNNNRLCSSTCDMKVARNEVPILKCIEGDTPVRYSRVLKIRNNFLCALQSLIECFSMIAIDEQYDDIAQKYLSLLSYRVEPSLDSKLFVQYLVDDMTYALENHNRAEYYLSFDMTPDQSEPTVNNIEIFWDWIQWVVDIMK